MGLISVQLTSVEVREDELKPVGSDGGKCQSEKLWCHPTPVELRRLRRRVVIQHKRWKSRCGLCHYVSAVEWNWFREGHKNTRLQTKRRVGNETDGVYARFHHRTTKRVLVWSSNWKFILKWHLLHFQYCPRPGLGRRVAEKPVCFGISFNPQKVSLRYSVCNVSQAREASGGCRLLI